MPILKYATDTQVREAIMRWRGNVSAAADELGMQPKNLRKRLETLGIDLADMRAPRLPGGVTSPAPTGPHGPHRGGRPVVAPLAPRGVSGRQSEGGPSRPSGEGRTFRDVQTMAAADEHQDDAPIKGVRTRPKPLRLAPPHQDQLRNAKLDLGARYRVETDENAILDQFFAEAFGPWLRSKLGRPAAAEKPARARKRDEGEGSR